MFLLFMVSLAYGQDNVDVTGQLVKPQGALLLDRKRASFNPLIKLRTDFNPEISNSVTEIK